MIQDLRGEYVGRRVLYHPMMTELLHQDLVAPHEGYRFFEGQVVEAGRVSSWNSSYVFVRFGDEDCTARACRRDQLVWEDG